MADPVNNNRETPASAEEANYDWLGVKARGDFELLFGTSATSDGLGGSAGAEVEYGYDDRYYNYGLEWSRYDMPGARGDGTASNNSLNVVDVVFGSTDRERDLGGHRKFVLATGRERMVGVGWLGVDNSDHYSDGVTNGNGGSETGMFLSSALYGGMEFYAGERFVIFPKIGLSMSTFYPFGGVDGESKWFSSPRTIALMFGFSIGYNDNSGIPTLDAELNNFDVANEFAGDAVDFLQLILAHKASAAIARGQGLLEDNEVGGGGSNQQTEDLAPLQAASSAFGAFDAGDDVGFIYKAWDSGRRGVATAKLIEMGAIGLTSSIWGGTEGYEGADLLGQGLTDLQIAGAGLMTLSNLDLRVQDVIRWGAGTALLLLGGAADNMGLVSGGMNGALGVTWSPDAINRRIISASTYSYYPWTIYNGDVDGNRGTMRKSEHIPVAKNWDMLMTSEVSTHVLSVANAEGRVENAATEEDDAYGSYFLPTSLRSGLGMEYEWRLHDRVMIAPAIDVFATQDFGGEAKAGMGAGAELALMIRLKDKAYLDLRSRVAVEKMIDGPMNTEIMPIALGLTFYNNNPFIFF